MSSSLKNLVVYLLNSEVVLPLVWGVVFGLSLLSGRFVFGEQYGFLVGGGSVVLASLAAYAAAKRLPYGLATDVQ